MAVKKLHQFFYYHNKYLNSMKCREISMGPSKCTIQCKTTAPYDHTIAVQERQLLVVYKLQGLPSPQHHNQFSTKSHSLYTQFEN
jgi:hypothetical protein